MNKALMFSRDLCNGCRYCELACAFHHKHLYARTGSLIRVITQDRELTNNAVFCRHCKRPMCVELCPIDAITRDESSAVVIIHAEKCIGCGICVECPLGGIAMDIDSGLAVNCDLCGGDPQCVKYCPTAALRFAVPGEARRSPEKKASYILAAAGG